MDETTVYTKEELEAKYKELGMPEETIGLLTSYFCAFANLYGVISLKEAYRIISRQNKDLLSFEKLYEFTEILRHEATGYFYIVDADEMWDDKEATPKNREIVAYDLLIMDEEDYYNLVMQQRRKPIYIPSREKLLRYSDSCYYERTREAIAFEEFLIKKKLCGDYLLEVMIEVAVLCNISEDPMKASMEVIENFRVEFSKKEKEAYAELFKSFYNNFRLRANRGFTPRELSSLFG